MKYFVILVTFLLFSMALTERCPSGCFCSKSLSSVYCSGKKLTSFPKNIPFAVQKFYMDHNLITSIPVGPLTNHSRLEYLDLRNNKLTNIEPNAFVGCGQLTQLYLVTNSFTSIARGAFKGLSSLTYLSLSANRLQKIPSLGALTSLQTLALEGNRIKDATIPKEFIKLKNLESLVLSNNPIGALGNNTFNSLRNSPVHKLEIARSNINKISSETFVPLKQLVSLKIGYNPLNEWQLVNMMYGLRNSTIRSLDIRNISLGGKLPTRLFSFMQHIENLFLRNNRIQTIHEKAFVNLPKLVQIDLTSCYIMNIDQNAFYNLSIVRNLFLTDNRLTSVPKGLPKSLQKLFLEKNELTTIKNEDFLNLTVLQELHLTLNQIHALQELAFAGLTRLNVLHINFNQLGTLPGNVFSPLVRLKSLSLSKNNLQMIQDHSALFSSLVSLLYLDLSGNQMSKMPLDLFKPLESLLYFELSNNNLGPIIKNDVKGQLFAGLQKLKRLRLESNQISVIHDSLFGELSSLTNLSLAKNQISHWDENLFANTPELVRLDLSYNLITVVNSTSLKDLVHLKVLDLSKSPFYCSCDLRWFRNWMNTTNVRLLSVTTWMCASPSTWQGKPVLSFDSSKIDCTDYTLYYILAGAAGGLLLSVLLVTVWYRKRYFVAFRLYKAARFIRGGARAREGYAPIAGNEKIYDIFLSFARPDCNWVAERLLPQMDNGRINDVVFDGEYRVCFSEREFDPSRSVVNNIDQHLSASRFALIVLSKHYGQDRCCEFELDCILSSVAEGELEDFIVVILGKLPAKYIPKGLRKTIEDHKFIEFPNVDTAENDFFERVKDRFNTRRDYGACIINQP